MQGMYRVVAARGSKLGCQHLSEVGKIKEICRNREKGNKGSVQLIYVQNEEIHDPGSHAPRPGVYT